MAAIVLQTIPSFYEKLSEKSLFISAKTYGKFIVCKDYCIANQEDKRCVLPACKNNIILLGETEELLHKMDTFCFTYQHVDCLYTLFKYRFSGKLMQRVETCLTMCREQFPFTKETEEWTKCCVLQKRGSGEKNLNSIL